MYPLQFLLHVLLAKGVAVTDTQLAAYIQSSGLYATEAGGSYNLTHVGAQSVATHYGVTLT